MIPVSLRITDFRSVRGTQTFIFPQEPGLYFMQGVNEAEPRLEANGAGKSTVWEALTWCWFGKTSRGLKAGEVCNWDAGKGAEVAFTFIWKDEECRMERSWSPNAWKMFSRQAGTRGDVWDVVDLAKEKDNPALAWLGLAFEPWLHCVMMAQSRPMFLDLGREAQATLFSDVLMLDAWLARSAKAGTVAQEEDRKERDSERELAHAQGQLEALEKQDHAEQKEAWEQRRRTELRALEDKHDALMRRRPALKEEKSKTGAWLTAAREKLQALQPDPKLVALVQDVTALLRETDRALAKEEERLAGLASKAQKLQASARCPECGQEMDAAHRQAETRACSAAKEASARRVTELEDGVREASAALLKAQRAIDEGAAERNEAEKDVDGMRLASVTASRNFDILERELDALEDEAERLEGERNPHADAEERARNDARELRGRIGELQDRIDEHALRQSLFSFWVRGFKEVRLSLVADALTELEVEVNSCVDALGLLGWELEFQVDRETKGGSLQRGFNCLVSGPHNRAQVPWEAWSGGEAQRLRVAATMGLSDLVRARSACPLQLEVWDEPTAGLSAQGIRDLLEGLSARAARERRQIWLVDHRAHDFGGFAGGVTVRRMNTGTVIEDGINRA